MKEILSFLIKKLKYPKLLLLLLSFAFAYMILADASLEWLVRPVIDLGYFGAYLSGVMFVYGFTAAPAAAILVKISNYFGDVQTSILGGLGALTGDWLIFYFIRHSFIDEIQELSKEKVFQSIYSKIPKSIAEKMIPVLGGILIASPLPDEIGVALLASSFDVSNKSFAVISFVLNTIGIYLVVSLF